jgi:ribosome-binding factor A
MKKSRRTIQIGDILRQEITVIVRELNDPDIGFFTVTEVDVSRDFNFAIVYVSVIGDADAEKKTIAALKRAKGRIRHLVAQRVQLRQTPDFDFRADHTGERADRIHRILNEISAAETTEGEEKSDDDSRDEQ